MQKLLRRFVGQALALKSSEKPLKWSCHDKTRENFIWTWYNKKTVLYKIFNLRFCAKYYLKYFFLVSAKLHALAPYLILIRACAPFPLLIHAFRALRALRNFTLINKHLTRLCLVLLQIRCVCRTPCKNV